MEATARLVVCPDARGRSVATTLRGEAPLLLRVTQPDGSARPPLRVHLVGGAAGPLGGDRLHLSVEVCAGAALVMRSVAASLAQPGPTGAAGSLATVSASVAAGAALDWWPEPLVSVRGSHHTQTTELVVADDTAQVRWVDEVVLGRHEEVSGRLTVRQRVTVGGLPVLQHTVGFDPATAGVGRHGPAHVVVTAVQLGTPALAAASSIDDDHRIARYPLTEACTAWIVLADSVAVARCALARLGLGRDGEVSN